MLYIPLDLALHVVWVFECPLGKDLLKEIQNDIKDIPPIDLDLEIQEWRHKEILRTLNTYIYNNSTY